MTPSGPLSDPGDDRDEEPDGEWEECDECGGEGVAGHDCGEDTCACANPQENVRCQTCNGEGGWIQR